MTYEKNSKKNKYYITNSKLEINKPNDGNNNIVSDWARGVNKDLTVKINGKLLEDYLKEQDLDEKGNPKFKYNFKDYYTNDNKIVNIDDDVKVNELKKFFKEVILSKLELSDADKDIVVEYLMKTFHQGGLMNPVSSALVLKLVPLGGTMPETDENQQDGQLQHEINIVLTSTGFKVQEVCIAKVISIWSGTLAEKLAVDLKEGVGYLKPQLVGKDYVLKAQGTINVDFSGFSGSSASNDTSSLKPSIEIQSNTIDFGCSGMSFILDSRSFIDIIMDFIKYLTGFNNVVDIASEEEERTQFNP